MSVQNWYVAKGSAGFTSDPEQAEKNSAGHPYACNGYVARVWKAHYAQDRARRDALWELLLDNMEEEAEVEASLNEARVVAWGATGNALRSALAIMHYGVVSEASIIAIKRAAERKYNE